MATGDQELQPAASRAVCNGCRSAANMRFCMHRLRFSLRITNTLRRRATPAPRVLIEHRSLHTSRAPLAVRTARPDELFLPRQYVRSHWSGWPALQTGASATFAPRHLQPPGQARWDRGAIALPSACASSDSTNRSPYENRCSTVCSTSGC